MRFDGHTHFVTIGLSIGEADCPIPTCGKNWIKTLQPIVLDHWPVAQRIEHDGLTTIGNWRGYGSVEHHGVFYGQKAHSLRRFVELPMRTSEKFMPALAMFPPSDCCCYFNSTSLLGARVAACRSPGKSTIQSATTASAPTPPKT